MASFTRVDINHTNRYTQSRDLLHMLNRAAILYPQIFSHVVVEIYPANPVVDYRFDRSFADHALIVSCRWHKSGKGCENATCYGTYPRGKMCDITTPPVVFMAGNGQVVPACQPACFMRQRTMTLLRRSTVVNSNNSNNNDNNNNNSKNKSKSDSVFVDDDDPTRCVECESLNSLITDHVLRRRVDAEYDLWKRSKVGNDEPVNDRLPLGFHLRQARESDGLPSVNVDVGMLRWNSAKNRCEQFIETLYRQIVEPYWRDPSHSICRYTNFRIGEQAVEGYTSADSVRIEDQRIRDERILGFLQRNSPTYCRAFDKNWNSETGDCDIPWWEQALIYTFLGEGILRLVRNIVRGDAGCELDAWVPTKDELDMQNRPEVLPSDVRTLRQWRQDVNLSFRLPPANVTLLDLGIDVLVTGNRLYWNNFEGVVSHMALFETVESVTAKSAVAAVSTIAASGYYDDNNDNDWRSLYRNYNEYEGNGNDWYDPWSSLRSSIFIRPTVLQRMQDRMLSMMSDVDERLNGDRFDGTGFTSEDAQHFIDSINEMTSRNEWLEIIKELGLSFSPDILRALFSSLMKRAFNRFAQYVARDLAGQVAGTLMRTGLRLGLSRMIGSAIVGLSTRLMVIAGAASTGIGVVISAIELLSLVIDAALLFGWDPGNYNSYTSPEAFRTLMDSAFYTVYSQGAFEIRVEEFAASMLVATNDQINIDTTSGSNVNGGGTANPKLPDSGSLGDTSFSETDHPDTMVSKPRWFNRKWLQCFSANPNNVDVDDEVTSNENDEGYYDGVYEDGEGNDDHVTTTDSVATVVATTTASAAPRRKQLILPRLALENDPNLFSTVVDLFYLGSLRTNSYGQLVNLNEQTSRIDDSNLADIVERADYRELGTISVRRDVNAESFNRRCRLTRNTGAVFCGIGLSCFLVAGSARTFGWFGVSNRAISFVFLAFGFLACLVGVLFVVNAVYLPMNESYVNRLDQDEPQSNTKIRYSDVIRDNTSLVSTITKLRRAFVTATTAVSSIDPRIT